LEINPFQSLFLQYCHSEFATYLIPTSVAVYDALHHCGASALHSLTLWSILMMHNTLIIKEESQHHLGFAAHWA
jgi:hypothetical protein